MADAKLSIVIDALNKASDDLKKVQGDMGNLEDATKKADKGAKGFGDSWAGVMTGISSSISVIQQVWQGMQKVYEVAREGAELEFMQERFDRLTESIGTTSSALLNDLREATSGTMSDAELMQSATDMMTLGFAKTHDEAVRLATVAGALDMNMNQLTLTLANKTTMRFDQLGIAVEGFDDKLKELTDSGMSADDAFKEAFLQQAEAQIDKVGNAADSAIGDFKRFEASFKNWGDQVKRTLSQDVLPLIQDLGSTMQTAADFQNTLNDARERGIITDEEYNHIQGQVHKGYMDINEATAMVRDEIILYDAAIDTTAEDMIAAAIAGEDFTESQEEVAAATISANDVMRKYNEQLLFNIASEGLSEDAALELAWAMGLVDEKTYYAYQQTNELKQMLADGTITADQYKLAILLLGDEIEGLSDKDIYIRIMYEQYGNAGDYVQGVRGKGITKPGDRGVSKTATGGPVMAGYPYIWQEYGYQGEVLVPSQNGYVLSRADAERILSASQGQRAAYGGPSADDIAIAVRDAILTAGVM